VRRTSLPRAALAALAALAGPAAADTIVLTSGRVIEADLAWLEGSEVRYRRGGTVYAVPASLVSRVAAADGSATLEDPDIRTSRVRLDAGDAAEALRFARLALFRNPGSVPALQALAAAQVALGDGARAQDSARAALDREPGNPRSLELLGDALAEAGDFASARDQYRLSIAARDEPRVREKLEALGLSAASVSSARFQIQYDGSADEPLGLAVLRLLDDAWEEYEQRLGFAPEFPVTVVLLTATAFRDTTRAPGWAAAWNDGTIRVPVMGLEHPTPSLVRVLRHELAHSFVASRTGTNCPTWLHEGVAQWLEGGDPGREDAGLARRARTAPLPRLESLEPPFVGLSEADATVAYAESLSAVAHLIRRRGEAAVRRLVETLGKGYPAVEALPTALGLSYGELQREWETHLGAGEAAGSPSS
jgi:tetratricopeptide (TPR) repeat protein